MRYVSLMKTATVADLRNDFRRVGAWVNAGEEVQILKRGKPFAKLVPIREASTKPPKVDFSARLKEIWGNEVYSWEDIRTWEDSLEEKS